MRKIKQKMISTSIITSIACMMLLPLNSYRDNAVDSTIMSSVEYEISSRGQISSNNHTYQRIEDLFKIPTITPTPIVKVNIKKKVKHHKKKNAKKRSYTKEDLRLLAGIIESEAGANYCNNRHQLAVASVVLNRTKSKYFPKTIKDVIFQRNPKQYSINTKAFNHPSKRAYKNAKYVLEHGSTLPKNCIFQSEFKQGDGVYGKPFKTPRSTTYICYKN